MVVLSYKAYFLSSLKMLHSLGLEYMGERLKTSGGDPLSPRCFVGFLFLRIRTKHKKIVMYVRNNLRA